MRLHEITFRLNSDETIILIFQNSLDMQHSCSPSKIIFITHNAKILLSNDSINENMHLLSALLTKALKNNLTLHKSLNVPNDLRTDIGYLWYEDIQNKTNRDLVYKKGEKIDRWVGESYKLWSGDFLTWIYNDENSNIILEMTPYFSGGLVYIDPNESLTPEEMAHLKLYDEWAKQYTPFLFRTISREVAQQWLDQANQILKQIEKNTQRMLDDGTFYTTPHYYNYEIKENEPSPPKNGQKALDQSLQIKHNVSRRIGVGEGEIIIFERTSKGANPTDNLYHGLVKTWAEISSDSDFTAIINKMIREGLINDKGEVLK